MHALRVLLDLRTLDEVEGGFADRVADKAVFLTAQQAPDAPAVGTAVHLEIATADGEAALSGTGVVAWSIPADKTPPGREAGVGVVFVDVDASCVARWKRMGSRPGAGSRVRVPGQRLCTRLKLGEPLTKPVATASPAPPSPPPVADVPTERPVTPAALTATMPFANLIGMTSEADAFLHASTVELPAPPRPRLMGLLADRALGDSQPSQPAAESQPPSALPSAPPTTALPAKLQALGLSSDDLADDDDDDDDAPGFLEAPTLDGVDDGRDTLPPRDATRSTDQPAVPPPPGLESLPDAPQLEGTPFADAVAKPFESQSTDIDLLASISAADIVSLDLAAQQQQPLASPPPTTPAAPAEPWSNVDDLPSADADDVDEDVAAAPADAGAAHDWNLHTDSSAPANADADWPSLELGETMVLDLRGLPPPEPWPMWSDLVDARPIGMFCTYGRRGQHSVEMFPWPMGGTKRFSRAEPQAGDAGDVDVFSSPADSEDLFGPSLELSPHDDPFARAGTDPRLNVEGVVGRAVRAAHADDNEADVFSTSADGEATRDEMKLPALEATPPPPSAEEDADTDLEMRRPPPKT